MILTLDEAAKLVHYDENLTKDIEAWQDDVFKSTDLISLKATFGSKIMRSASKAAITGDPDNLITDILAALNGALIVGIKIGILMERSLHETEEQKT